MFLSGEAVDELDEKARLVRDENFLLIMNAHHEEIPFLLPTVASGMLWIVLIDTSCQMERGGNPQYPAGARYPLQARSLALLVQRQRGRIREDRRHET